MHELEKLILDDINDVYFLLQEEVIWSGKPSRSNKDLLLIYAVLALIFISTLIYTLSGNINANLHNLYDFGKDYYLILILISILLYFVHFDYSVKKKEMYWLLKNHFVIKGGVKNEFKVFRYTDLEMVQNESFNGKKKDAQLVRIYFKHDIENPFSYFEGRTKKLELGPMDEASKIYNIFLDGMHEGL